jgi:hypothetical protein
LRAGQNCRNVNKLITPYKASLRRGFVIHSNGQCNMFKLTYKWYVYAIFMVFLLLVVAPFEYGSFRFKTVINPVIWIIPGIICLRLLRNKKYKHIQVKLIILFGIYILVTGFFLFSSVFCKYTDEDSVCYVNKKNKSLTIVRRGYSCYLTTEDYEYYKCWTIIGNLKWKTKIDYSKVDTTKWER